MRLATPLTSEARAARSEEHTSELQSQSNLVCRLLLEKKKHKLTCCSHSKITSSRSCLLSLNDYSILHCQHATASIPRSMTVYPMYVLNQHNSHMRSTR